LWILRGRWSASSVGIGLRELRKSKKLKKFRKLRNSNHKWQRSRLGREHLAPFV